MKKTAKAPTGAKCTSTTSGMQCALTGKHDVHSSSERRTGQHMTWSMQEDGTLWVQVWNGKKKGEGWPAEAPPPPVVAEVNAAFDDFAREVAQPEPVTTEPQTPGFAHDPAPQPGDTRTNERGQSERWCWGPVGGWGWRSYPTSKGKGCTGCGRHKADCLCKQMGATAKVTVEFTNVPAGSRAYMPPEQPAPLTKIGDYEVHPAAARFDMLEGDSWTSFLADVRENGQRDPIVLIPNEAAPEENLILDGRNRLRACIELGREPRFRDFGSEDGDGDDPVKFVVSVNIQRRHMDETQRSLVGADLVPMYEAQARARMLAGKNPPPNSAQGQTGEAVELAARAVNVGKTSVKAAVAVKENAAPEVLAAAKAGRLKVSTAADLAKRPKSEQREIMKKVGDGEIRPGKVRTYIAQEKKRDIVRKINEQRVAPMPAGPFGVIYGDYPWLYENSDQHEGSRGHMGYPPMEFDDVLEHARQAAKRAAKDCIVALWVTNLYLPRIGFVLEAYGATHRTVYTWPKPKFGVGSWGRGQTEHLVIASIGEPTHTLNEVSTLLPSWKPAHPGEHSSKPAEVAELLRKHCGGPFLELFAREPREGWTTWGAEAEKFATEAA